MGALFVPGDFTTLTSVLKSPHHLCVCVVYVHVYVNVNMCTCPTDFHLSLPTVLVLR